MKSRRDPIVRVISTIAVIIAIFVTIAVPAAYFMISYQYMGGSLEVQAELSARSVEGLVIANPKMWQFEEIRLHELLERHRKEDLPATRLIRDAHGNIVTQVSEDPSHPLITRGYYIYDAGIPVARIELSQSLTPLIVRTSLVGSSAFFLGAVIFLVLRAIPLKAVREANRAVEESEQALRQSEALHHDLVDTAQDLIWQCDAEGRFSYLNPAWEEVFGYSIDEMLGKKFADFQDPGEASRDMETFARLIHGDIVKGYETLYRGKNGRQIYLVFNAKCARDADGKAIGARGTAYDITDRKQAENELQLSRQRLSLHVQQTPLAVLEFDLEGIVRGWNPAAEGIFGYTGEEAIGRHWTFMVPESFRVALEGVWEGLVTQRGGSRSTNDNLTKDGRTISCEWFSTPLVDPAGKTIGVASLVMDVTERLLAEERLKKAQQIAKLGNWNWNTLNNELIWSEEVYRIYGLDPVKDKPSYEKVVQTVAPECRERFVKAVEDAVKHGAPFEGEYRMIGFDGQERYTYTVGEVRRDREGRPLSMFGIVQDITERKIAQERIRQSEEFIRTILDTVDEGFIVVDRDCRILAANKSYCGHVGRAFEEIIGSKCYELSHKAYRPCYEEDEECAVRQVLETGKPQTIVHRHKDAYGNVLYVETKAYPITGASGVVTSVIETISDITEKLLLEEERLKTQKLESIGRLAGGIAHDFNNLLQGVFGYISMAKITHDQREKSLSMLDQAEEALHLSVNLTNQLLTFSKGGKPLKKLIRLKSAVENAVKFALSGSNTNYEMVNPAALWSVEADEGQVAQVIQNIVMNANEAMAGSGTVDVSLENVVIPAGAMVSLPDGGQFVRIAIRDSGIGIPEQNMAQIFDPYFTTKQKGSGLGLATSYSIIKNHDGVIEVESEINRGTTFTIYLPSAGRAEMEVATTTSDAVGTRKGRILLMDDEEIVRRVAMEMLDAMDNDMVSAEDGGQAVELFRQAREAGTPFDLVILDLTVKGGMGGEEAVRKIRDIDPDAKVVVSSGYADSPIVSDYRAYGFSGVLNKPFRIEDLHNCLNLLL